MALFSKAALLKWLEREYDKAEAARDKARNKLKYEYLDGQSVGIRKVLNAIAYGEIGEER